MFSRAVEDAHRADAPAIEWRAKMRILWLEMHVASDVNHAKALERTQPALEYFEKTGDHAGLAMCLGFIGDVRFWQGECAAAIDIYRQAEEHAKRGGAVRDAMKTRHSESSTTRWSSCCRTTARHQRADREDR